MEELIATSRGHVTILEINRPPHNFFDRDLIQQIGDALDACDAEIDCRAVVLASNGRSFCAGANFANAPPPTAEARAEDSRLFYQQCLRLFRTKKPVVAAVHGAAIGGGLGLALAADFRVTCPEARFAANFTRIGFHPGFGLTTTLPQAVGVSTASLLMLTGRRIGGEEAMRIGLADSLVAQAEVREASIALAEEIAGSGPLAVVSTRETLRGDLYGRVEKAIERELSEQTVLRETEDFAEGVRASAERRPAAFTGR